MQKEKADDAPNVVMGTFSLLAQTVDVLFDSGATHSFISVKLVETLELNLPQKSSLLSVVLPDRKAVLCEELYEGCPIKMYECEFVADLYKFEFKDFWVIREWIC